MSWNVTQRIEKFTSSQHIPGEAGRVLVLLLPIISECRAAVAIANRTTSGISLFLSNTLSTDFCIEAVQEAINRYGRPEIFNTDQGCQFTSLEFTGMLKDNDIKISMDDKGCWRDNVFVERLWRSVKYEEVYLYAYDSVNDAKRGLDKYFKLYNQNRPHSSLDDKTPDEFYFDNLPELPKAA